MFRYFFILPILLFLCWQGLEPSGGSLEFEWLPSQIYFGTYWNDVLLNAGGFYLFALLVLPSFRRHPAPAIGALFLLVAVFELVQFLFLPFRWATIHDVISGWTGVSLAALTLHLFSYRTAINDR